MNTKFEDIVEFKTEGGAAYIRIKDEHTWADDVGHWRGPYPDTHTAYHSLRRVFFVD